MGSRAEDSFAAYCVSLRRGTANGTEFARPSRIDRIDLSILTALFSQARISKVQMSEAVGISASRCYERMRRWSRQEIIRGYHADIDIARLASCLQFQVQDQAAELHQRARQAVREDAAQDAEIVSCHGVLRPRGLRDDGGGGGRRALSGSHRRVAQSKRVRVRLCHLPVSKGDQSPSHGDLKQIVGRLSREESGSGLNEHRTDESFVLPG